MRPIRLSAKIQTERIWINLMAIYTVNEISDVSRVQNVCHEWEMLSRRASRYSWSHQILGHIYVKYNFPFSLFHSLFDSIKVVCLSPLFLSLILLFTLHISNFVCVFESLTLKSVANVRAFSRYVIVCGTRSEARDMNLWRNVCAPHSLSSSRIVSPTTAAEWCAAWCARCCWILDAGAYKQTKRKLSRIKFATENVYALCVLAAICRVRSWLLFRMYPNGKTRRIRENSQNVSLSLRFISAVCGFISVFVLLIDARHRLEKIYSVWTFVRYRMHEYIGVQGWNWNETFPYRKIRTLIFRISRNCVLCTSYSSVRLFFAHLHAHTNTHTQRQNIHWRALIKTNSNKFPERMKTNDGNKIRTKRKKVKKKWKNENKICRFISFSRFFVCLLFLLLILLLCKIYDEITVHNTHTRANTEKKETRTQFGNCKETFYFINLVHLNLFFCFLLLNFSLPFSFSFYFCCWPKFTHIKLKFEFDAITNACVRKSFKMKFGK